MDVQYYISGRSSVSLWTFNMTSMDVPQFPYRRTTCGRGRPPLTQFLHGRRTLHPWTSTSFYMDVQRVVMDVHQLLYGRTNLHKWTSISFSMGVQHYIRGRPPISIRTYNVWPWTSTSYYMDVHHSISGRKSESLWKYNMTYVDVQQFLYGRTRCGRGRPPVTI